MELSCGFTIRLICTRIVRNKEEQCIYQQQITSTESYLSSFANRFVKHESDENVTMYRIMIVYK